MVTVLLLPTFLSLNAPVAETVTVSPITRPVLTMELVLIVAVVVPSYSLLVPARPEMVSALAVIDPVVVAEPIL